MEARNAAHVLAVDDAVLGRLPLRRLPAALRLPLRAGAVEGRACFSARTALTPVPLPARVAGRRDAAEVLGRRESTRGLVRCLKM